MSRGLGDTQRAALTVLADADRLRGLSIDQFADRLGVTHRRAHKVADSLEAAGLVRSEVLGWHLEPRADGMPTRVREVTIA